MDYRFFRPLAGLILLIGGSCVFTGAVCHAGEPIQFSAPIIPLAIPLPDVEVKQPNKLFGSKPQLGLDDGMYMPPPEAVTISRSKRSKDPWDMNNPLQDDFNARLSDDLFAPRPGVNSRMTNSANFNSHRALDESDSDHSLLRRDDAGINQNQPKFGAQNDPKAENGRDSEGYAQGYTGYSKDKEDSLLFKVFSRDPGAMDDRFSAFTASRQESTSLTGAAPDEIVKKFGFAAEPARSSGLPPGYSTYNPLDDRQRGDEQAATSSGDFRAWDPAAPRTMAARMRSNPDQINTSRVVAPVRPAILQMPKRPGDPNPF